MSTQRILKKTSLTITSVFVAVFFVLMPVTIGAQEQPQQQSSEPESTESTTSDTTPSPRASSVVAPTGDIADNVCRGVLSAENGTLTSEATIQTCQDNADEGFGFLARRIINLFSIVVGAVSVIMIIIGGFRYIISGGDSGNVQAAKNTILYAIVGLLIVLFSQLIIRFILSNAVSAQ